MPTIEELKSRLRLIEGSMDRGGTYPEELDRKIRDVRTEVSSLRKLVGDVIDYLQQQEVNPNRAT